MQNPASTSWDLRISQADYDRLRAGLEEPGPDGGPWRVTSEMHLRSHNVGRPHRGGAASGTAPAGPFPGVQVSPALMVVRVAQNNDQTGAEHFVLGVRPVKDEGGGGVIEAITWDQQSGSSALSTEQSAKSAVARLLREHLKCDLESADVSE